MAFQLGSINYGVSSDQYSFLDQNPEDYLQKEMEECDKFIIIVL